MAIHAAGQKSAPMRASAKFAIFLILFTYPAFADDPIPTTQATVPPDKRQYTPFNPVPVEDLRDMDTDRPDKTNSPHTIDAGHLQIEIGAFDYSYDRDRYHGANSKNQTLDAGQFEFRLGVLNNLELNAVVNAVDFARITDFIANQSTRQNGFGDTFLGATLNLWGNDDADQLWATGLAIQPQIKFPTARSALGNGHAELFVGLPFLINLPEQFHLGLQTTISWERSTDDNADVTGWQNSAALDRVFFDKFDIYLEYWSHVSTEKHQEAQQTLDVGTTYSLTDNVILDTGLNFGLNHASTNLEWLAGVSVRF